MGKYGWVIAVAGVYLLFRQSQANNSIDWAAVNANNAAVQAGLNQSAAAAAVTGSANMFASDPLSASWAILGRLGL